MPHRFRVILSQLVEYKHSLLLYHLIERIFGFGYGTGSKLEDFQSKGTDLNPATATGPIGQKAKMNG